MFVVNRRCPYDGIPSKLRSALIAPNTTIDAGKVHQPRFVDGLLISSRVDTEFRPLLGQGIPRRFLGIRSETAEDFFVARFIRLEPAIAALIVDAIRNLVGINQNLPLAVSSAWNSDTFADNS